MPLHLIKGPINSGKTTRCLSFLDNKKEIPSTIYIVPTESQVHELRRHALEKHLAMLGETFVTWSRFVELITPGTQITLTHDLGVKLIYKVLSTTPLEYFRAERPSVKIARHFANAITALKKNSIGPAQLKKIIGTRPMPRDRDLLSIFEAYEKERLILKLTDEGDICKIAIENVGVRNASIFEKKTRIIIDEFTSFLPGQLELISLIKKSYPMCEIIVSFPTCRNNLSMYASYLEKYRAPVDALADRVETLSSSNTTECSTLVKTARSPLQETRSIALLALEKIRSGSKKSSVAIVDRQMRIAEKIFDELLIQEAMPSLGKSFGAFKSPLLHNVLTQEKVDEWPDSAPLSEYLRLCKELASEEIKKMMSGSRESLAPYTVRNLYSKGTLAVAIDELATSFEFISTSPIKRESFVQILFDELSERHGLSHLERHLPFEFLSFDSPPVFFRDYVFIPKMIEGNIPFSSPERLFFSQTESYGKASELLASIFKSQSDLLAEEALCFDAFVSKCAKSLTLTYPIISEEGQETSRSSFLDTYPSASPLDIVILEPYRAGDAKFDSWIKRLAEIEDERSRGSKNVMSYRGHISSKEAKELVNKRFTENAIGARELENYTGCPFTFFVEVLLHMKSPEEEMPEIQPKDKGTLVHAVLEVFYSKHLDLFKEIVSSPASSRKLETLVENIVDDIIAKHPALTESVAAGLLPLQKKSVVIMVTQTIEAEAASARSVSSPLWPSVCEWSFGKNDESRFEVPVENEPPLRLVGRIDRIDVDDERSAFLVVDYKSGRVNSITRDIEKGRKLQIPLYIEAARRFFMPGKTALGGLLLDVIQSEKKHGLVRKAYNKVHYDVGRVHSAVEDEKWEELISISIAAASKCASEIRDGKFDAEAREACPIYCKYADICRFKGKRAD